MREHQMANMHRMHFMFYMHCMHVLYPHMRYMHGGIYIRGKEKGKRKKGSMHQASYVLIKKLIKRKFESNW